jgi:predicted MFS family arabinose efflux permease
VTVASVSFALLILFVVVEDRRGDRAMMPLALFASKSFVGLTLLTLLLYGALGGLFVLIPYVLITEAHYSATAAGAALLPLPLVLSVASPMMGGLAGRIGARLPLVIGPLVVAVGFLLTLRIGAAADYWTEVLPAILTIALGLSGAVAPLTTAVLNSVDARHTGSASGFNSAVARTGGLVATALLGSVLAAQGNQLVSAFHLAMIASAVTCTAAAASAFILIKSAMVAEGEN